MWRYQISTGELTRDGEFVGTGYSGSGYTAADGRNNPAMVHIHGKGPIPPGLYQIEKPRDSETLGPCVMNLTPMPGTNDFGRSLFRIHGNNKANNASHGCIILGPSIRHLIAASVMAETDSELEVLE